MIATQDYTYLNANLNDTRLTNRFNKILESLPNNLSGSIAQAMESKAATKGAYRFFRNKKVSPEKLLSAHTDSLEITPCLAADDYYLILSDTTTLDYSNKRGAANLGYLTQSYLRGMYLHNDLIINPLGAPIGLLKQDFNNRSEDYLGNSKERKNWPIEDKESMRWVNSFNAAQGFSEQHGIRSIWVADREADIIEVYAARWHEQIHFIVRAQHDRCLANSSSKLFSLLKQQPVSGTYEIDIIDAETLKVRTAELAVRYCPVKLQVATTTKNKQRSGQPEMFAIEVYEINAPDNVKQPIRWVLLTSLPVHSFQQALNIIRIYVKRWLVERFHYLLKTGGAKVEELQFEKPIALQNVITTYSIATIEVIKLRYLAENQPDMSIYKAGISPSHCEILYAYAQANIRKDLVFDPDNPPTIWQYCRVLGMIGGFIPRKSQPLPGLKILTRASEKFKILLLAFDVFMSKNYAF